MCKDCGAYCHSAQEMGFRAFRYVNTCHANDRLWTFCFVASLYAKACSSYKDTYTCHHHLVQAILQLPYEYSMMPPVFGQCDILVLFGL
jgi:hypothetical protein